MLLYPGWHWPLISADLIPWKLYRCLQIQTLLRGVVQWGLPTQTVSLELIVDCDDSLSISDSLTDFLASFRGLEALHLNFNDPEDCTDLWQSILSHKLTLIHLI
jgi:hypothetical protein